jgi:DNA-binding SARP family transcriptional activator
MPPDQSQMTQAPPGFPSEDACLRVPMIGTFETSLIPEEPAIVGLLDPASPEPGDVRFLVLGRVALRIDHAETVVPGRRERAVLAVLLAARRQVVSAGRIIEEVWGPEAADSAPGSLQVAISRLRTIIEPDRARGAAPEVLVTSGAGYVLRAPEGSVDAERFTTLVEQADQALTAGRPGPAADLADAALDWWGGTPFGDELDSDLIRAEQSRLEGLHLCSLEVRAGARLDLGRPGLLTGDLEALVQTYPLSERLWELLVLALYRSGRQGEALAALRRARRLLVEELGVDPSPALQQLEADVLGQSARLAVVTPPAEEPAEKSGLIGRSEVLATLERPLRRALAGRGGVVVISGEAGIGKSALVKEIADRGTAQGARVLSGRAHEADVSPAYWPWLAILRTLAAGRPAVPVITQLLSPTGAPSGADAGSVELRTYDAVSTLLAEAAAERPLIVVLEDVQWADTASLQLLAYAAQALALQPVLMLVTVRDTEPSPALQACLAALGRLQALRVPLPGLTPTHVRDLIAAVGGGEDIDEELTSVVTERTDGNPFFVIELVRLLAAEHRLDAVGAREVPVPHGVQDVLRMRLAVLSEPAGRLLRVAAVIGREFDLDVVSAVSGTELETAIDLLEEAIRSHSVEEGDRVGRYRFTHALVRETLVSPLSRARLGALHAAIARALEPRLERDPDLAPELAHHFGLGAEVRPALAEDAVRYAVAAAGLAERRGALDEALQHWEQALAAEELAAGENPRRRYDVLLGLGRARHRRGELVGSRRALDSAVGLARQLGDIELIADAATSFSGAGVWNWREVGSSDPAMISVLRECSTALPPGARQARVLASLSMELVHEWRSLEADEIGREAMALARTVGDTDLLAQVASMRMLGLWGRPGAAEERLGLAAELLRLPLTAEQELYTRFGAAPAHLQRGDSTAADREMTRCIELARRLRHTGADVPIAWWRLHRALATADPAGAQLLTAAIERHGRSQIVARAESETMGRLRAAGPGAPIPEAAVIAARGNANPAFRALVAHALSEQGRRSEALDLLGEPVPDGAWDYSSVYGDCLRVDVLAEAGPEQELRRALDRIRPWGHEYAIYGSNDCLGSIEYFIGRGLEALGEPGPARAAYRAAIERNRLANILPWRLRSERRLAEMDC